MPRKAITDAIEFVALLMVAVACVLAGGALTPLVGALAGLALGMTAGATWLFGMSAVISSRTGGERT